MTAANGSTPPVQPLNLVDSSSSAFATATKSRSARSTPRASISLLSPGLSAPYQQPLPSEDVVDLEEAQRTLDVGDDVAELKEALRKVLLVADKMSETLASLRAAHQSLESQNRVLRDRETDLETSLLLANSNLTLERANNEMLEEALKREGSAGAAKDLGWKRWSEREGLKRAATTGSGEIKRTSTPQPEGEDGSRRRSSSSGDSNSISTSPTIPTAPSGPAAPAESSRFFKFRFGAGVRDSVSAKVSPTLPNKPAIMPPVGSISGNYAHLTSASLPSLHATTTTTTVTESPGPSRPSTPPPTKEDLTALRRELDSLKAQFSTMQTEHSALKSSHASLDASHKTLTKDKQSLEEELESLSQALFEEANKMVADERKKCAAYEEELEVCRSEKDALKGALKVVEAENGMLRQASSMESTSLVPSSPIEVTLDDLGDDAQGEDDAGSVSSLQAVKSPTDHKFPAAPAQPQADKPGSSSSPSSPNRLKKAATPHVSYTPVYI